ncbi:MAG: helix-turn-helix transcriptional regulator [Planctomycetota bacterium]
MTSDHNIAEPLKDALLVSAADAAALIGVGRSHFYAMHSSGRLGPLPVKLGNRSLWIRQELTDWTAQRCPSRGQWQTMRREDT